MARDSQTVVTVTKLLLNDNHLQIYGDPDLLPIPWNEKVFFALELFDFINFSL
jgi:fatty acid amide hydrolase